MGIATLFKTKEKAFDPIVKDLESSKFEYTSFILRSKYYTARDANIAIKRLSWKRSPRSIAILRRTQIESFLTAYYFWVLCFKYRTDLEAIFYYFLYYFKEKSEKIHKKMVRRYGKKKWQQMLDYVDEEFDAKTSFLYGMGKVTHSKKKNRYDLGDVVDQIKSFSEEEDEMNIKKGVDRFMDEYSVISSFVHGGRVADELVFERSDDFLKYIKDVKRESRKTSVYYDGFKFMIMLLLAKEKQDYNHKINRYLQRKGKSDLVNDGLKMDDE